MVSINAIFNYLFLLSKCGMGYAPLQGSVESCQHIIITKKTTNIPYGINYWLYKLVNINTQLNNSK